MLNFPAELRDPLLNLVGAQESSEASVVASLPFDAFREAVSQDLYLESGDKPTLFQQGRFYKFFKDLTKALADPAPPSTSSTPGTAQPIVLTLPDTNNRLPLKDVLDQTMTGTFTVLPEKEIADLRKNYVVRTGMAPTSAERPTDEQLSALAYHIRNRADGRVRPPFVEFATFVPFHGRFGKLRTFQAMVLSRDGSWSQKSLKGPENFAQWEACWNVYSTALVMLDVASPGALKT